MIDVKDLKAVNGLFPHVDAGETKLEGQAFGSFYPNVKTEKTMLEHIIRQNMVIIALLEKLVNISFVSSLPAQIKEKEKIVVAEPKKGPVTKKKETTRKKKSTKAKK